MVQQSNGNHMEFKAQWLTHTMMRKALMEIQILNMMVA